MKKILTVILILVLFCSCTRVITEKEYKKEKLYLLKRDFGLPDNAKDVKQLGNDWVTFSLDSTRFLYRYSRHSDYESVGLTVIK